MYLNKANILGNLTRNPELKTLPNGTKITSFSLATNRTWKDKDGSKKEEVEYHNVVVFGRQAETSAQYLVKGQKCLVTGRLKTQSWEDTATNKKMYRTEIIADNVQFGSRSDSKPTENPSNLNETLPIKDIQLPPEMQQQDISADVREMYPESLDDEFNEIPF
jgi:single-strand DNA-binding protein